MDQRAAHLERTSYVSLLLSLEEEQIVAEHVRDGYQLRIDAKAALHISYNLKSRGFEEEARRIFELAEPLEPTRLQVVTDRSEEHTSELQSHLNLVCRLLLE